MEGKEVTEGAIYRYFSQPNVGAVITFNKKCVEYVVK